MQSNLAFEFEHLPSPRRRTSAIEIAQGRVLVRTPMQVSIAHLQPWLKEREAWVISHLTKQQSSIDAHRIEMSQGASIPINGDKYDLYWRFSDRSSLVWHPQEIEVFLPHHMYDNPQAYVRRLLQAELKQKAAHQFQIALTHLSAKTGLKPKKIEVKSYRRRWGQCSSDKIITLNWRLIHARPDVQRYVMIHELCHLQEMNHSVRFWSWVARFCPNHRELSAELRDKSSWLQW
ncbi:M48 family metallopeptidase [Nitrincola tibetensis]|uniref:M48 family metallopeptidase n=1 Tax=Nitrincola tibetensis TaxID=2219697 RepID=UPI00139040A9|nr:SprT family zinc-dependent metalloprotease [Nitrincola tibetensis]